MIEFRPNEPRRWSIKDMEDNDFELMRTATLYARIIKPSERAQLDLIAYDANEKLNNG